VLVADALFIANLYDRGFSRAEVNQRISPGIDGVRAFIVRRATDRQA